MVRRIPAVSRRAVGRGGRPGQVNYARRPSGSRLTNTAAQAARGSGRWCAATSLMGQARLLAEPPLGERRTRGTSSHSVDLRVCRVDPDGKSRKTQGGAQLFVCGSRRGRHRGRGWLRNDAVSDVSRPTPSKPSLRGTGASAAGSPERPVRGPLLQRKCGERDRHVRRPRLRDLQTSATRTWADRHVWVRRAASSRMSASARSSAPSIPTACRPTSGQGLRDAPASRRHENASGQAADRAPRQRGGSFHPRA